MKKIIRLLLINVMLVISSISLYAQTIPPDSLYLGQIPPGDMPIVFAPGYISLTDRRETKIVFSQAGDECLIGIGELNTFKILYTKYDSSFWSVPQPATFITNIRTIEPFFSPDGKKIFFTSFADIYMSNRESQSWSTPIKLGIPINSLAEEYHPSVTSNGKLYFCSTRDNPLPDIYLSKYENGNYTTVEKLGKVINMPYHAWDPFIAPDESYIIFTSIHPDGFGNEDQYISFYKNDRWTNPKNLGSKINTNKIEYGSYISPDNKYYFFSRPDGWGPNIAADIYWVSASFIDSLKFTNFIPYLNYQIPNQTIETGLLYNYTIPDSTFIDDDGNNTLTYSATLSNGNPLPVWLSFSPDTQTFSGTPTEAINLNIKVTATDSAYENVSCTFAINITITGTEESKLELPKSINLFQNYPNPFNPTTKISWQSSVSSWQTLKVYDVLGREIATLVDEFKPAGIYEVEFEANKTSSGIYLYVLKTSNFCDQKKMIVLK